jgi:hypothetical protein
MANCSHPAIIHGMCVKCGMNIKEVEAEAVSSKPPLSMMKQPINNNSNAWMMPAPSKHLNSSKLSGVLTLSGGSQLHINSDIEAGRIESTKITALMGAKKLALVLDLDHTLVHAVQVPGRYSKPTNARQGDAQQLLNAATGMGTKEPRFIEHHFLPIEV